MIHLNSLPTSCECTLQVLGFLCLGIASRILPLPDLVYQSAAPYGPTFQACLAFDPGIPHLRKYHECLVQPPGGFVKV